MRYPIRATAASLAAVLLATVAASQIVAGAPAPSASPSASAGTSDLPADKQAIADALRQRQLTAPRGGQGGRSGPPRHDVWAGPPIAGPAPGPGSPGDCAP